VIATASVLVPSLSAARKVTLYVPVGDALFHVKVLVTPPALVTVLNTAPAGNPDADNVMGSLSTESLADTVKTRLLPRSICLAPMGARTGG
jgi:hypothetical protein